MNDRWFLKLYPRAWRERYGDVICGATNEWMARMTGNGYWNDQAQRTTRALAQSAVPLGPVALVSAVIPWRDVPYARLAASALGGIFAIRIGGHIASGPIALALVLAGLWIGYRTVSIEPVALFE